jgi:hypothetical protein
LKSFLPKIGAEAPALSRKAGLTRWGMITKVAKRLDCGAFTAAFIRGWTLDVKQS